MKTNHTSIRLAGALRCRQPAETLAMLEPYLGRIGITRVANITGLDVLGLPVHQTIRPSALHLTLSQGKGLTNELAKISAIMEAMELYHAERTPIGQLRDSYVNITSSRKAVHPQSFARGPLKLSLPLQDTPLYWVTARDELIGYRTSIPHAVVSLNSSCPSDDFGIFSVSSNGLAAGNSRHEAVLHGLYEVIERDAVARSSEYINGPLSSRIIDPVQLQSESVNDLVERFRRAGSNVILWALSAGVPLPVFACYVQDNVSFSDSRMFMGSGCHIDAQIAALRALTEAAQTRLTHVAAAREDLGPSHYAKKVDSPNIAVPLASLSASAPMDTAMVAAPLSAQLSHVLRMLKFHGYKHVYVYDHACVVPGFFVVHVLVPGMRFRQRSQEDLFGPLTR